MIFERIRQNIALRHVFQNVDFLHQNRVVEGSKLWTQNVRSERASEKRSKNRKKVVGMLGGQCHSSVATHSIETTLLSRHLILKARPSLLEIYIRQPKLNCGNALDYGPILRQPWQEHDTLDPFCGSKLPLRFVGVFKAASNLVLIMVIEREHH